MAPDASYHCGLSNSGLFRYSRRCFLALFLTFISIHVTADQALIEETIELPFTYPFNDQTIKTGSELQIKGTNKNDSALIFIVRIDNSSSKNYRSRFNREFSIQPGPFSLSIPITGLKTSGKQPLEQPYTRMTIFVAGKAKGVMLESIDIKQPPPPPKRVLAVDFGLINSPVFPGFELILPEDRRLQGNIRPRNRPSGDSLISDGFEGIKRVSIPWKNGYWKLSLWTRQQGEWEYMPHSLNKKIIAENQVMVDQQWTQEQWITEEYLHGKKQEAIIDGDLWDIVGKRQSGFVQKIVHITDEQLDIFLEGDHAAQYLSGLILEPVESTFSKNIEDERKSRFLSLWPTSAPDYQTPDTLELSDITHMPKSEDAHRYLSARGSLLNLKFQIQSPEEDPNPVVVIASPRSKAGDKLSIQKRFGHWRFERPAPNASSLVVTDSLLRGDFENFTLPTALPRNLYLQISIPTGTEPGLYSGSVQLFSKSALKVIEYSVEVLPVDLPKISKSVGLYLEPAPFYQWFEPLKQHTSLATACDLSLLASYGFTNIAPSLDTPSSDVSRKALIEQLTQLQRFGFNGPVLAYSPLKRLLAAKPDTEFEQSLVQLNQLIRQRQLPDIYWSIFDEPAPEKFSSIKQLAKKLRGQSLEMKSAGHLNNPKQSDLLKSTHLAILNHGFGVDLKKIEKLRKKQSVWLYNMPVPRLAAGFYLWKSKAEGYLQWHGRMPTADPFDPTDGREGDVVYLYPWSNSCPAVMDIHQRLLDLHEAILDLRWLQWLDKQAETVPAAQTLKEKLIGQIPNHWKTAEQSLLTVQLLKMRQDIIEFSQSLNNKEAATEPLSTD